MKITNVQAWCLLINTERDQARRGNGIIQNSEIADTKRALKTIWPTLDQEEKELVNNTLSGYASRLGFTAIKEIKGEI